MDLLTQQIKHAKFVAHKYPIVNYALMLETLNVNNAIV